MLKLLFKARELLKDVLQDRQPNFYDHCFLLGNCSVSSMLSFKDFYSAEHLPFSIVSGALNGVFILIEFDTSLFDEKDLIGWIILDVQVVSNADLDCDTLDQQDPDGFMVV